jgi:putative intracellular protease/amidase
VLHLVREMHAAGKLVAAICAAPVVLRAAGLLAGRRVTAHPSRVAELAAESVCTGARVEWDAPLLTSQGPGTALEFGLALLERLGLAGQARALRAAMIVN